MTHEYQEDAPPQGQPIPMFFVGTKVVKAQPMTRLEYNQLRGWTVPDDENPADDGYMVEYTDGGAPNHPDYDGYISWSPKAQFDAAYRPSSGMNYGLAIESLKRGERVARAGWNGHGMYLVLVLPYTDAVHSGDTPCFCYRAFALPAGANGSAEKTPQLSPYIAIKTADGKLVPWTPSQSDQLADDWRIVGTKTMRQLLKEHFPNDEHIDVLASGIAKSAGLPEKLHDDDVDASGYAAAHALFSPESAKADLAMSIDMQKTAAGLPESPDDDGVTQDPT